MVDFCSSNLGVRWESPSKVLDLWRGTLHTSGMTNPTLIALAVGTLVRMTSKTRHGAAIDERTWIARVTSVDLGVDTAYVGWSYVRRVSGLGPGSFGGCTLRDGGRGKGLWGITDWSPVIVDEPYDRDGTPGRACLECNSAWPASEPDDEPHHHARTCPSQVAQ